MAYQTREAAVKPQDFGKLAAMLGPPSSVIIDYTPLASDVDCSEQVRALFGSRAKFYKTGMVDHAGVSELVEAYNKHFPNGIHAPVVVGSDGELYRGSDKLPEGVNAVASVDIKRVMFRPGWTNGIYSLGVTVEHDGIQFQVLGDLSPDNKGILRSLENLAAEAGIPLARQ